MHRRQFRMFLAATGFLACCHGANAKVTRLEIVRTVPYGSFLAGDYVRLDGRVVGELAPDEKIPGIEKIALNARGRVQYATPITIIAPKDAGSGNGALIFDVANRGRPIALALYNSPRGNFLPLGSFESGTGFLQDRGFTVVTAAWELGQKIELPTSPTYQERFSILRGSVWPQFETWSISCIMRLLTKQARQSALWRDQSKSGVRLLPDRACIENNAD